MQITQRKKTSRWLMLTMLATILLPLLVACVGGGDNNPSDEPRVLRIAVMYGDSNNNDYLKTQYTDLFAFNNSNIEIEFVSAIDYGQMRWQNMSGNQQEEQPDPLEEMKKLIESANPPDLVFVSYDELGQLIDENLLSPLDPFIQNDKFDLSDYVPAVIESLKDIGGGQLYALAPTFSSSALVYNKALFEGVAYPHDGMSWDEIFDLAELITKGEGDERQYGFGFSQYAYGDNLYYEMGIYTAPLQLSMYDENVESMLVDSDQWEAVWTKMSDLHQKKIFPEPPDYSQRTGNEPRNPFEGDNFMSSKLAMMPIHYSQLNQIINANNNADKIEGFERIDWDVVTLPTHPEAPDVGGYMYMDPIMGIPATAANSSDAWDFIQFINGERWAQLKSKSVNNMVSRQTYIQPYEGVEFNLEAFFQLKPARNDQNRMIYQKYPNIWQVENIGQQKFSEVLRGEKEVRQALKEWQTEGDQMLAQMKENPDGGGMSPMPMF